MRDELPSQIGPYSVTREIGRGGMGVVYLAHDTKLDRPVAIKALPEHLADDPNRFTRFEREGKALAQLNHPNVAGIYGIEEQDGRHYLILEYVEGDTLAERLDAGVIPVEEALELAIEIATGIEAAHDAGVIHRDLKPDNIKITPDGKIKVLDFGLAKTVEASGSSTGPIEGTQTPTMPRSPTIEGAILGTAAYMSPEQARGRKLDKRTDIWSFGVVLFELLTGANPFIGETATDSIGAVLHKGLDLNRLPKATPASVKRVLTRCVERDKALRYRDIGDVRIELITAGQTPADEPNATVAHSTMLLVALLVAVVVAGVGGLMLGRGSTEPTPARVSHMTIEPPAGAQIRFSGDLSGPVAVSPDGSMVVFSASMPGEQQMLWVRQLNEPDARILHGTANGLFPFWSPDSKSVGFFTRENLKRIDLASETVITVCESGVGRGASWTGDGRIAFSPEFSESLVIVDADGGDSDYLTRFEEDPDNPEDDLHTTHRWPHMLPDGEHFLFLAAHRDPAKRDRQGLYLGSLDGGTPRRLMASDSGAAYQDGWLLFVREGVLLASRLDIGNAKLVGGLRVVAKDIAVDLSTWNSQFSVGGNVLVYNRLNSSRESSERRLSEQAVFGYEGDQITHFRYDGTETTRYGEGVPFDTMRLSPNGRQIVVSVHSSDGTNDLWLYPTAWYLEDERKDRREEIMDAVTDPDPVRLTFLDGSERGPQWSPDSERVAFMWTGQEVETPGIYVKEIGGGTQQLLLAAPEGLDVHPSHWTSDGEYLVYVRGDRQSKDINDLWAVPTDGSDPIPLVELPRVQDSGQVSPNGKWLVYHSNETGTSEVYVVPFAPGWDEPPVGGRWQVSQSGGTYPLWSHDGTRLFYVTLSGMLIAVEVDLANDSFRAGKVTELFQSPFETGSSMGVLPDDMSFVFSDFTQDPDAPISVILNWQQILEEDPSQ